MDLEKFHTGLIWDTNWQTENKRPQGKAFQKPRL